MSHVAWSVCLSVLVKRICCARNGWTDWDAVWKTDSCGYKEPHIKWRSRSDKYIHSCKGWQVEMRPFAKLLRILVIIIIIIGIIIIIINITMIITTWQSEGSLTTSSLWALWASSVNVTQWHASIKWQLSMDNVESLHITRLQDRLSEYCTQTW